MFRDIYVKKDRVRSQSKSGEECGPEFAFLQDKALLLMRHSPHDRGRMSLVVAADMDTDRLSPPTTAHGPSDGRRNAAASSAKEKNKRGIVYLSYIPDGLNPRNIRVLLSRFGEINRIYFEPGKLRNGVAISFREGWIEFLKKRVAKEVASALNGSVISCRKKAAYNGSVWSIKYLHRVKWHHLSEQMSVEKVARDQRLRLEMGRVKKESDFFAQQNDLMKKRQKKGLAHDAEVMDKRKQFYDQKQNRGDDGAGASANAADDHLLQRIFS